MREPLYKSQTYCLRRWRILFTTLCQLQDRRNPGIFKFITIFSTDFEEGLTWAWGHCSKNISVSFSLLFMCHCLDKACISWGLAAQDHSQATTSCHPVITYVRAAHLKFLIKFTSSSFGENKEKFNFRVCPVWPVLRSSDGLRLLDLIFRRQRPSMIVEKSQDEKPEKPRNDSVPSARQESGKPQRLPCVYKQGKIPQGKNKVRWAAKRQKKKVSELRQAGENKPRKCGRSQVAYWAAKSNWCGSFLSQMGGETTTWVSSPVPSLLGNGLWWAITGVVKQRRRKVKVMFMRLSWVRWGLKYSPFY